MIPATPSYAQAPDWRRQWREALDDPRELLQRLGLGMLAERIHLPERGDFPMRVPLAFVARMRRGDADDPLLRQVLPLADERIAAPGFDLDAVGDLASRTGTGLLQKYAGRALLVTTGSCAVHCRYCFRRHFPYAEETAARDRWQAAIAAIRADTGISEVLLSGGDPLSLSTARLRELTDALAGIPHIRRLRLHTRLPIVLPARVDRELTDWLGSLRWPLALVVHANHANEIDGAVRAAFADLRAAGAMLLNQSVLLRGVNDSVDALSELSETLFDAGVLPYYLHLLDRVHGAAHFEVDAAAAAAIERALRERLPGYLMPRWVREIAGEPYKTPYLA
jgi:EF-P beta-lysylation protein EpmB